MVRLLSAVLGQLAKLSFSFSLRIIQIRISDYVNFYCSEIGQRVYIVTKEQYDNCEIPSEPTEMVGKCSDEFFINIPQYFSHEKVESSSRKLVQNGEIVYFTGNFYFVNKTV